MTIVVCDECGKLDTKAIYLATGYVFIDDKSNGQFADLCLVSLITAKVRIWISKTLTGIS